MRNRKRSCGVRWSIGAALGIVLASVTGAASAAPMTGHDVFKRDLEDRRASLVDGYQKVGSRNPMWDEKALSFLEASAVTFA